MKAVLEVLELLHAFWIGSQANSSAEGHEVAAVVLGAFGGLARAPSSVRHGEGRYVRVGRLVVGRRCRKPGSFGFNLTGMRFQIGIGIRVRIARQVANVFLVAARCSLLVIIWLTHASQAFGIPILAVGA